MKYLEWTYRAAIFVCIVAICSILYDARKTLLSLKQQIDKTAIVQKEFEQKLFDHISRPRKLIGNAGPAENE